MTGNMGVKFTDLEVFIEINEKKKLMKALILFLQQIILFVIT